MSGNFLSCSKGVKDPLEVPEVTCDLPGEASAEMGLMSPGGGTSWFFSSWVRYLSSYEGDLRDLLVSPQERPVSM